MRFFPRNRKSRHDALVGLFGAVSQHPHPDSLTRRDRLHRYNRGNDATATLGGALAATDATTFNAGGALTVTIGGDDIFSTATVAAIATQLIAAFALLTGLTLIAGSFAINAPRTVLTVTVPVNTVAAGAYVISFAKTCFRNANVPVNVTITITA